MDMSAKLKLLGDMSTPVHYSNNIQIEIWKLGGGGQRLGDMCMSPTQSFYDALLISFINVLI